MNSPQRPEFPAHRELGKLSETMRSKWGWFVAFGVLAAISGLLALVLTVTATIVSVVVVGLLMVGTGAVEIGLGFRARGWDRALYWEFTGLIYLVAGILAIVDPIPASVIITLFLGAGLLAAGVVRVVTAFSRHDPQVRAPLILAGAVTALLGLVIVLGWPRNSMSILGTLLGVDLLFTGIGWVVFGLRLRPTA